MKEKYEEYKIVYQSHEDLLKNTKNKEKIEDSLKNVKDTFLSMLSDFETFYTNLEQEITVALSMFLTKIR